MTYTEKITKILNCPLETRNVISRNSIIIFLLDDQIIDYDNDLDGAKTNHNSPYFFIARPSANLRMTSPTILGISKGVIGTLNESLEIDSFKRVSSLNNPLSNQLGMYLIQELKYASSEEISNLDPMILSFTDYLVKLYLEQREKDEQCEMGITPFQLKSINEYLKNNMDKPVFIKELASIIGISTYHFIRMFKRTTGDTPHKHITKMKMERAKELLLNSNEQIIQVGMGVGIYNPSHFSQLFKSYFGTSPYRFRKSVQCGHLSA